MDAVGSAIRVDTRGREVMRILPRVNEDVNEEWISDKTRHVVDGLRTQRLDQPYHPRERPAAPGVLGRGVRRDRRQGQGAPAPSRIGAIAGDLAAVEEMFALKDLMTRLGVANIDCRQDGAALDPRWGRASYLFNATIAGIEQADALLIVGSNPRREAAVLNARIRKRWRAGNFPIGADRRARRPDLSATTISAPGPRRWPSSRPAAAPSPKLLKDAERPLIIVGAGALARPDGAAVAALAAKAALALGAVEGRLERLLACCTPRPRASARSTSASCRARAGSTPAQMAAAGALDVLFLLGADEIDIAPGAFVVYIGTHGDRGAHRADVILPGAAYTEKSGIYVNTEGRVQMADARRLPAGRRARGLGDPARAVRRARRASCPTTRSRALRAGAVHGASASARIDQIAPGDAGDIGKLAALGGTPDKAPFGSAVDDFYLTNPIARASAVMAECSALAAGNAALTAAE